MEPENLPNLPPLPVEDPLVYCPLLHRITSESKHQVAAVLVKHRPPPQVGEVKHGSPPSSLIVMPGETSSFLLLALPLLLVAMLDALSYYLAASC